jgi:hypothetical protein
MVAQISSETFNCASLTPPMDDADSDDLVLALETARVLEAQGDMGEAVRWLRRAADQAEKDGNDARVLVVARAAADLTNRIAPRTPVPHAPSRPPSAPAPISKRVSSPPPVPARIPSPRSAPASIPSPRAIPSVTTSPRPPAPTSSRAATSSVPAPSPRVLPRNAIPAHAPAAPVDARPAENTVSVATMRVAIPASSRDANVFVVRRMKAGQPLPAGTTEAMLVLTAESKFVP